MKTTIILTILFTLSIKNLFSCDCDTTASVSTEINRSSLVIHGRIIKAEYEKKINQNTINE